VFLFLGKFQESKNMFAGRFSGKRDLKNRVGENFGKSVWGVLWGRVGKLGTDFIPVRLIYNV